MLVYIFLLFFLAFLRFSVCLCLSVRLSVGIVFCVFQFVSFVGSPVVVSIYVSIDVFLSISLFLCLFVACNAGVLLG